MEFKINFDEKEQVELFCMTVNIGVLDLLRRGHITINEAEQLIYSPRMSKYLKILELNSKIIDLIDAGCEIEDVESLMPQRLNKYLDDLKNNSYKVLNEIKSKSKDDKIDINI